MSFPQGWTAYYEDSMDPKAPWNKEGDESQEHCAECEKNMADLFPLSHEQPLCDECYKSIRPDLYPEAPLDESEESKYECVCWEESGDRPGECYFLRSNKSCSNSLVRLPKCKEL
jgi:hypothetical protein